MRGTPRSPRRRRAVALPLVAALLAGSALLRFGMSDLALAREAAGDMLAAAPAIPAKGADEGCAPPPDVGALLAAIRQRTEALDARESRVADRMQALRVAEAAIDTKMAALLAAEEDLARTIAMADGAADDDVARLTAVYENMKPKVAAEVFAAMTPEFAAGFLGRMRPEAAAEILSGLEPGRAYAISVILAGRNAGAPRE